MKKNMKLLLGFFVFVGINFFATNAAIAVQVQFVNNTPAFTGEELYWYTDDYYECTAPSGGRTCSSELSEGSYNFDVRDSNDNILCSWDDWYVSSESSDNRLVYPNRFCEWD